MSRQVFRSPVAVVVWWVWVLFAVGNLIDLAVQGHDHSSLVAAFVLLVVTGVMWVAAQRPRLVAEDSGLTIVNPLRDHRVAWVAVAAVDTTDLIRVRCQWPEEATGEEGKKTIYAWAAGSSKRRQAIAQMRARRAQTRRGPSIGVFGASPGVFGASSGSGRTGGFGGPGGPSAQGARGGGSSRAAPAADDTGKIVAALTARADEARAAAPDVPATRPVSTWSWSAFAAVGVPALALLIVIVV